MYGFTWHDDAVAFAHRCAARTGKRHRVYRTGRPGGFGMWAVESW